VAWFYSALDNEVMKTLVDRWIEMATELSNLRMANKHT